MENKLIKKSRSSAMFLLDPRVKTMLFRCDIPVLQIYPVYKHKMSKRREVLHPVQATWNLTLGEMIRWKCEEKTGFAEVRSLVIKGKRLHATIKSVVFN